DGGNVPALARLVREHRSETRIVNGVGLSEYQMRNLGVREATGDIVAFSDGDCEPRDDWIEQVVRSLWPTAAGVIGVQGRTLLRPRRFSRQLSVLLYGLRMDGSGCVSGRVISDNCAFLRNFLIEVPFEPASLPTTPETVLWTLAARQGLTMVVNDGM